LSLLAAVPLAAVPLAAVLDYDLRNILSASAAASRAPKTVKIPAKVTE
jgi:hypothetical protein